MPILLFADEWIVDGAAVLDRLTELPVAGRALVARSRDELTDAVPLTMPSFVAGAENQCVAAAVSQLLPHLDATDRPSLACQLLFLYGPAGTGKTHLSQGIVQRWQQQYGADAASYLTAADFRRQFREAIAEHRVAEFRRRLRSTPLVAIDDVDRLPTDLPLQCELANTLDELADEGAALFVASRRPIGGLRGFSPAVLSRLAAGLSLQLAPPGQASTRAIAEQATRMLGCELDPDAALALAQRACGTTNDLFGLVFELLYRRGAGRRIDRPAVEACLARREDQRVLPLPRIIAVVARYYRISQKVLRSSTRRQSVVLARAMIVYLARERGHYSYDEIGRLLGGRDHTTIMHNYRKLAELVRHNVATQQALDDLQRLLGCAH